MQDTVDMVDDPEYEEEEPSFSDPEDFVDDVDDDGEQQQEKRRLSGLLLSASLKKKSTLSSEILESSLDDWFAWRDSVSTQTIRNKTASRFSRGYGQHHV